MTDSTFNVHTTLFCSSNFIITFKQWEALGSPALCSFTTFRDLPTIQQLLKRRACTVVTVAMAIWWHSIVLGGKQAASRDDYALSPVA